MNNFDILILVQYILTLAGCLYLGYWVLKNNYETKTQQHVNPMLTDVDQLLLRCFNKKLIRALIKYKQITKCHNSRLSDFCHYIQIPWFDGRLKNILKITNVYDSIIRKDIKFFITTSIALQHQLKSYLKKHDTDTDAKNLTILISNIQISEILKVSLIFIDTLLFLSAVTDIPEFRKYHNNLCLSLTNTLNQENVNIKQYLCDLQNNVACLKLYVQAPNNLSPLLLNLINHWIEWSEDNIKIISNE